MHTTRIGKFAFIHDGDCSGEVTIVEAINETTVGQKIKLPIYVLSEFIAELKYHHDEAKAEHLASTDTELDQTPVIKCKFCGAANIGNVRCVCGSLLDLSSSKIREIPLNEKDR